jgi:DNA invertase Pin-like site-specific DNA recombinase
MVIAMQQVRKFKVVAEGEPVRILRAEPDLVDRIFEYLVEQLPEIAGRHLDIKRQIRAEFASQRGYVRRREPHQLQVDVARLFNGRNATEVARQLQISRATVYRLLKQPGRR